jgi:diguanylate cyclase (GGDEF)-like protein
MALHPSSSSSLGLSAARRREAFVEHLPSGPIDESGPAVPCSAGHASPAPASSQHRLADIVADLPPIGGSTDRVATPVTARRPTTQLASAWLAARTHLAGAHPLAIVSRPLPGGIPGLTYEELVRRYVELERVSRTDTLTGIPNRYHLDEQLGAQVSAARRHRQPLSVLILDIDNFKRINDRFGHLAGDTILREFTARLNATLRLEDVAGRWGGEEFLVILPNTDAAGALLLGERIRNSVSAAPMPIGDEAVFLTVSGGTATARDESPDELIRRADEALYRAKHGGRNRIAPQALHLESE